MGTGPTLRTAVCPILGFPDPKTPSQLWAVISCKPSLLLGPYLEGGSLQLGFRCKQAEEALPTAPRCRPTEWGQAHGCLTLASGEETQSHEGQ